MNRPPAWDATERGYRLFVFHGAGATYSATCMSPPPECQVFAHEGFETLREAIVAARGFATAHRATKGTTCH